MTLSEIANFVCAKMMDTESGSVAICKDFIKRQWVNFPEYPLFQH